MSKEASWLSSVLRRFNASATGESRRATSPEDIAAILRAGSGTSTGANVNPDTAMRVAAVYACVRVLADSVAMLPLRLHKDDGFSSILAPEHPADKLLRRPNQVHTAFELKRFLMACLVLRGNAYFFRHLRGSPREELLPLHPGRMAVSMSDNGALRYEYTTEGGRRIEYPAKAILHVRALSTDGIVGLSVIQAAAEAIGLSMTTEKHGGKVFGNGASPGGVLKHPLQISAEAAKRLKESFEEKYSGADNAHKTMLLEEGMSWEKVAMTSEESQFIDSRKFQRSEIAMFFGVPPHMIGDVERGTSWGSGIEAQGLGFVLYTLLPWLTNIEQACERDLLTVPDADAYSFKFDTDALTRADFLTRQQGREIQRRNGIISANEWRRGERMNPRTDGEGDSYSAPGSSAAPAPDKPDKADKSGKRPPPPNEDANDRNGARAHAA